MNRKMLYNPQIPASIDHNSIQTETRSASVLSPALNPAFSMVKSIPNLPGGADVPKT